MNENFQEQIEQLRQRLLADTNAFLSVRLGQIIPPPKGFKLGASNDGSNDECVLCNAPRVRRGLLCQQCQNSAI